MIFETLNESNERGELLIIGRGMCHFHVRRDGQLTIREIIVQKDHQGRGVGRLLLNLLKRKARAAGATSLFARCPVDLPANGWYAAMGFALEGVEATRSGRELNLWRLTLRPRDRMAATIRHNRARGVHGVMPMAEIVATMLREGWADDEIARELGMDADEVLRFKQQVALPELFRQGEYSAAWE
jgi:GNAT superfamily N-acetyltransferase